MPATSTTLRGLIQALCAAGESSLAVLNPSAATDRRAGPRGGLHVKPGVASDDLAALLSQVKSRQRSRRLPRLSRLILASQLISP